MEDYEKEILIRMYDKGIMGMNYKSIQTVASKIKWVEILNKFHLKKSFQSTIRNLIKKELVSDHGKSGNVCSLTADGVKYVKFLKFKIA